MKKKFSVFSLLLIVMLLISNISAFAASGYIQDDADIISSTVEKQINTNLSKLEENTGAKVKLVTVKSLNGKSIAEFTSKITSSMPDEKYAVFVMSYGDRKNKFVVGSGLNNVFTSSEIDKIASLPNNDFKKNDFDSGLVNVAKAIDQDISTTAVKAGKAVAVSDGLGTTVKPKTNWLKVFFVILVLGALAFVIYLLIKKRMNKTKRPNNDYLIKETEYKAIGNSNREYKTERISSPSPSPVDPVMEGRSDSYYRRSSNYTEPRNYGGSTVIINERYSNNDRFVEGMMMGSILSQDHHHDHCHHEETHHKESTSSWGREEKQQEVTSGDWERSSTSSWERSSTSSWDRDDKSDNYSSNNGSSSWDDDENKKSSWDSGSSSWDSGSDSSSWDSGSSSDSGSSDW
jgi:uncharacterized membrane protein YgcG